MKLWRRKNRPPRKLEVALAHAGDEEDVTYTIYPGDIANFTDGQDNIDGPVRIEWDGKRLRIVLLRHFSTQTPDLLRKIERHLERVGPK